MYTIDYVGFAYGFNASPKVTKVVMCKSWTNRLKLKSSWLHESDDSKEDN